MSTPSSTVFVVLLPETNLRILNLFCKAVLYIGNSVGRYRLWFTGGGGRDRCTTVLIKVAASGGVRFIRLADELIVVTLTVTVSTQTLPTHNLHTVPGLNK